VGYNAAGSGGSNKGPSNPDYLKQVQLAIDTFLINNPTVKKADVPVEMVTASGSGLDPDISPKAAAVQIPRIAKARGISEETLVKLVNEHTDKPLLGIFGPKKINVLKLNVALDGLTTK
jgi:K+-transporting ATPase ATPase C chain